MSSWELFSAARRVVLIIPAMLPLNGANGTQAIRDTDAGQLDGDSIWDRAVGPMQFIPST